MANVLFAKGAAHQFADSGVRAYSVHPGAVKLILGPIRWLSGTNLEIGQPVHAHARCGRADHRFSGIVPTKNYWRTEYGGYFADSRPKSTSNKDVTDANADWALAEEAWPMSNDG